MIMMFFRNPSCVTTIIKMQVVDLAAVGSWSSRASRLRTLLLRRFRTHAGRPKVVVTGMRPPLAGTLRQLARRNATNATKISALSNHASTASTIHSTSLNNNNSLSPVLIVGGGPTGLFLALLLARYKIPSIVLEQQSIERRFHHPQAHFLNTRTMEILCHALPDVYRAVQSAMSPVDEWQHFRFGGASLGDPNAIVVRHAVDIPLQADRDANGVVAEDYDDDDKNQNKKRHYVRPTTTPRNDLSPVTVGHLAQHTFGKILFDAATRMAPTTLWYGTEVTQLVSVTARSGKSANSQNDATNTTARDSDDNDNDDDDVRVQVHTRDGRTFRGSWCIGADGAHSWVRRQCGIPMHGQAALQHLMNIYVRRRCKDQQSPHIPPAMLYATYSPLSVAMTVRHNADEYIIQIPYFPPYQTPEVDFAPDKLSGIVGEIFGDANAWIIVSAHPWTMGSLVAERYVSANDDRRVLLMGDAAHVFPPAGGFGMNTGLQDAYNLAWKIAAASRRKRQMVVHDDDNDVGTSYERERRPVAQRNAALSVRNYERLLRVTQSAYLDRRHPELLRHLLDRSPLPLTARQTIFRSMYQAALFPFRWLSQSPQGLYARHIRSNLRSALQSGTGLPLLFPAYEIGLPHHCYYDDNGRLSSSGKSSSDDDLAAIKSDRNQTLWQQDTMPSPRALAIGALVPHTSVAVFIPGSGAELVRHKHPEDDIGTTVDLPAQLHNRKLSLDGPIFVLLAWKPKLRYPHCLQEIGARLSFRLALLVRLVVMSDVAEDLVSFEQNEEEECTTVVRLLADKDSAFSCIEPCAVLIRPDGHVAGMAYLPTREDNVDGTVEELSRFL